MIWFAKTSYGYIAPQGFFGHIKFAFCFPVAFWKFNECMRREFRAARASTHPHNTDKGA